MQKSTDKDLSVPVVTLSSPVASQSYAGGGRVSINGTVPITVCMNWRSPSPTMRPAPFSIQTISVHNLTSYTINENWINSVAVLTNATLKVEAHDHSENHGETVQIILNP
ncbi:MAG: hypothetical protein IPI66_07300 [Chitinophagaceae bacterium]|nr:hypothetical protein [Chitinophagaceae bacterium]